MVGEGEEIDPGKDTSETVISPFIKFYGRLTTARPSCSRECRSRASPRFSMACDLITEIVLITPTTGTGERREKRSRG